MWWEIKTEAPKVESPEAKAAREFTDNLTKVTDIVTKTPEKSEEIASVLDTNFKKWLDGLSKTEAGKTAIKGLEQQIKEINTDANTKIDAKDKAALTALLTLITPLTMETSATPFDSKGTDKITAEGKTDEAYNTTETKWSKIIADEITKINGDSYKDLPGKKEIVAALTNPKKENIVSLQNFLFENLPKPIADKLADSSRQWDADTGKRDGKYGEQTNIALTAYLDAYTANMDITTKKTSAEQAANAVATSTENLKTLNESKTTATTKLDAALTTYKEADYTPTEWKSLTDAKTTGQKAIDAATTPDWVTKGEATAEAAMKTIPTINQVKTVNKETIHTATAGLDTFQDTQDFKNLPNDIQGQINKILNLSARDNKIDKKIDESQQIVTKINGEITRIQADNIKKWQEMSDINKTITIMKTSNLDTKKFEDQQATITTAIENNNKQIQWLKNELIAPQSRLERLQNRDKRIAWRLTEKLTDIAQVLKTAIDNRTVAIAQLGNEQAKTMLTNEIKTITKVQTDIQKIQDANTRLTQLETPVNTTPVIAPNNVVAVLNRYNAAPNATPNATEKFITIETKFKNIGYVFELDNNWNLNINWPKGKDMTTIQDEDFIWRSMDQMTSQNKLQANINRIFAWVWNINISATINDQQWKNSKNEYITRAQSITIRNIKLT